MNKFFSKVQNYSCHIAFDSDNSRQSSHLRRIQRDVNRGANNYGKQVRTTTVGHKDAQKTKYFKIMSELAEKLEIAENLKDRILAKSKEYFTAFRNLKEQVQRPNVVMAACMVMSIRFVKGEEKIRKAKLLADKKPVHYFPCVATWDWTPPTKSEIDALSTTVKSEYSRGKRRRVETMKWRRCGTEDELSLNNAFEGKHNTVKIMLEGVNYEADLTKMLSDTNSTASLAQCVSNKQKHFRIHVDSVRVVSYCSLQHVLFVVRSKPNIRTRTQVRVSKLKANRLSASKLVCKFVLTCTNEKLKKTTMMILKSRAVSASVSKKKDEMEFVLNERFMFRLEEGFVPKQLMAEFRSVPKLKQNKKKSLKLGVVESVKLDLDRFSVLANQNVNIMNEDKIFGT